MLKNKQKLDTFADKTRPSHWNHQISDTTSSLLGRTILLFPKTSPVHKLLPGNDSFLCSVSSKYAYHHPDSFSLMQRMVNIAPNPCLFCPTCLCMRAYAHACLSVCVWFGQSGVLFPHQLSTTHIKQPTEVLSVSPARLLHNKPSSLCLSSGSTHRCIVFNGTAVVSPW